MVKIVQKKADDGEFYPRPLLSDSGLASSSDFHTKLVTIDLPITYMLISFGGQSPSNVLFLVTLFKILGLYDQP